MNALRLLAELLGAVFRPARGRHRPRRPAPRTSRPPRQARRTYRGTTAEAELLGRDHPAWRVVAIPDDDPGTGRCYVATRAAHTVRAATAEAVRRKMAAVDAAPPPAFVRPYIRKAIP